MASQQSRELAAQAWCKEKTSGKVMDTDLAEAFAEILDQHKGIVKADGVHLITAERERQLATGRTPEIDDTHVDGELLHCALEIADDVSIGIDDAGDIPTASGWPYIRARHVAQKYGDNHIARLAIAGALIAAEIDRLLRKQNSEHKET